MDGKNWTELKRWPHHGCSGHTHPKTSPTVHKHSKIVENLDLDSGWLWSLKLKHEKCWSLCLILISHIFYNSSTWHRAWLYHAPGIFRRGKCLLLKGLNQIEIWRDLKKSAVVVKVRHYIMGQSGTPNDMPHHTLHVESTTIWSLEVIRGP